MEDSKYAESLAAAKAGSAEAICDLVQEYEPHIRRAIRHRLSLYGVRLRVTESELAQSVLRRMLEMLALSKIELKTPDDLRRVLARIAQNRIVDEVRRQKRESDRRLHPPPAEAADVTSPSAVVAWEDLLKHFRDRLSDTENRILDLRLHGETWQQIAEKIGEKPDAIRMRLQRKWKRIQEDRQSPSV